MNTALPPDTLPDIADHTRAEQQYTLDWVGMNGIDLPLRLAAAPTLCLPARIDLQVDLCAPHQRGIHMSRLYLALQQSLAGQLVDRPRLLALLQGALASHADTSQRARIRIRLGLPLERPALKSDHRGWKTYPVSLDAELGPEGMHLDLGVSLSYSSTCPCSAALSRQLLQQAFAQAFADRQSLHPDEVSHWLAQQGSLATPHSQRSSAHLQVRLQPELDQLPLLDLIDSAEACLQTAVQTAVKREDEQAFAALNGGNLMFCEDAARRLKQRLLADPRWLDFRLRVEHHESLHAHDAVAACSRGVPGGLVAR